MRSGSSRRRRTRARSSRVWRLLDLGRCDPLRAVAFSEAVAPFVASGKVPNTLMFARADSPCICVGFHQSPKTELDPEFVHRHRMPVIRRVEGGGTVYLDRDQLFYQFVYSGTGGSGGPGDFARYLGAIVGAARSLGLPAELRRPSDIVVRGRKISGNAGGEWEDAQIITGDVLGRTNVRAMAGALRLPHPALRPLLEREMARQMTSWELETGGYPEWEDLMRAIVDAFAAQGLGPIAAGRPTREEETRFRSETVPRHRDASWGRPDTSPIRPGTPERKIRIAGPHGLVVFADPTGPGYLVAVAEGPRLVAGYRLGLEPSSPLRPLPSLTQRPLKSRVIPPAPAGA